MVAEIRTECLQKTLQCSFVLNSNRNNISCIETMAVSKKTNSNTEEKKKREKKEKKEKKESKERKERKVQKRK